MTELLYAIALVIAGIVVGMILMSINRGVLCVNERNTNVPIQTNKFR